MNAKARLLVLPALLAGVLLLSGCAETELVSHWVKKWSWAGEHESAGSYKIGDPYRVGSVWYYPREDFSLTESGIASWYGPDFHGHKTANGEIYDENELTAAHRTLQMPSLVRVTNLENGRSVVVRINDRGPYMRGRVIDVSKRAAILLGFINRGTARVRLEVLPKESREIAEAARRGMDTSRLSMSDLQKYETAPEAVPVAASESAPVERGPEIAMSSDSSLPESLQTPTITVEQLNGPGQHSRTTPAPDFRGDRSDMGNERRVINSAERQEFIERIGVSDKSGATDVTGMVSGHMNKGHFMPDPVVSQERVAPTGIFVQAGAFAVKSNAERMRDDLSSLGPVVMEQVTVKGRQLYRVKIGPVDSVSKADAILDKVIASGNNTAHVVHH